MHIQTMRRYWKMKRSIRSCLDVNNHLHYLFEKKHWMLANIWSWWNRSLLSMNRCSCLKMIADEKSDHHFAGNLEKGIDTSNILQWNMMISNVFRSPQRTVQLHISTAFREIEDVSIRIHPSLRWHKLNREDLHHFDLDGNDHRMKHEFLRFLDIFEKERLWDNECISQSFSESRESHIKKREETQIWYFPMMKTYREVKYDKRNQPCSSDRVKRRMPVFLSKTRLRRDQQSIQAW